MFEQRSTIAALVAACMVTAFAAGSFAQQAAAPAVLVQAAEQAPIADQFEFVGRAAAVDKVELRARVKGFLGPRKFSDGDMVKMDEVVFTIEPETYQATVDQKVAQRDSAQAALTNADLQLQRATELLAHQHRHQSRPTTSGFPSSCRPRRISRTRAPSCATPRSSFPTPTSSRRSRAASAAPRCRPATSCRPTPACWPRW